MKINGYKRTLLFRLFSWMDVVWIEWDPEGRTRKHDHGKSFGAVFVVQGKLFEIKKDRLINTRAPRILSELPDIPHIAGNLSSTKKARSLHVYIPRLTMNFFEDTEEDNALLKKIQTT